MSVPLHKKKFKKENVLLHQCRSNGETEQKHKMFDVKTSSVFSRNLSHPNVHGESKDESNEKPGKLPGNDTGTAGYQGKCQLY